MPNIEQNVYRFLHAEAKDLYAPLFVIGGMPDHVHVLSAVRPVMSPSQCMHQLKGSSSRFISQEYKMPFEWQEGYGVFSVSEQDVPRVIRYIENQKEHHAQGTTIEAWEQTHHWNLEPDGAR